MTRTDVRTPVLTGDTSRVGGRIWRKQVLPLGKVRYQGKDLTFTRDYMTQVIGAFNKRGHDTVPVMLADATNSHTMAFTDAGGEVLDLDLQDDGLWATVRLSDDAARQVEFNRRAGVSVRIKHGYEAGDGRTWPAAMQHLLLTWDPRANGMKPWQSVELSDAAAGDDVLVLDLSDLEYEPEGGPAVADENTNPQLSADELAALRNLLAQAAPPAQQAAPPAPAPAPAPEVPSVPGENTDNLDDVDWDNLSDDDVDRIIAGVLGDAENIDPTPDQELQPAGAQLSNPADVNPAQLDALDLANAQIAELQRSQSALTSQLDAAAYKEERDQLVRDTGLPPAVIDLARPLLEGARHEVALSNGAAVDAGQVMRSVLTKIGETLRVLDLAEQFKAQADADANTEAQQDRERLRETARQVLAQTGLSGLIHSPAGN